MIILNETLGTYGGSITLILRICTRLVEKNIRTAVLTESMENVEIVGKLKQLGVEIFNFNVSDKRKTSKFLKQIYHNEKLTLLTFNWNKYLVVEAAKKSAGLSFANLIYCIHPTIFYKGKSFPLCCKKIISDYRKVLIKMVENGSVYFMDEDTINTTQKYFGFEFKTRPPVLLLPMICNPLPDEERDKLISESFQGNVVFTASRAEFPFKGYLFGLIEDFRELKCKFPELKLQLVVGGEEKDFLEFKSKIAPLLEEFQEDVTISGWMDYGMLLETIKSIKLFVGMGTGVLDVALLYKPAIAVKHDIYENYADAFFYDDPLKLCAYGEERALRLIEQVFDMSFENYSEVCKKSFETAKNFYGIDNFIDKILSAEPIFKGCLLNRRQLLSYKLNSLLNKIRHKKLFSYSAMRK